MINSIHIDRVKQPGDFDYRYRIKFVLDGGREFEADVIDSRISLGPISLDDNIRQELDLRLVIASGMDLLGLGLSL